MSKAELRQLVLDLPEVERLEIAEAIWTSLEDPDSLPLPSWQKELLDERLAQSEGEEGRDWEEIRAEIWPERH